MSELHIFDMMAFVHAGHVNKYSFLQETVKVGATWETHKIPTGGASLIFNSLYEVLGKGDVVVVTDRNPTVKKEMIPGYKSNRKHTSDIQTDKQATEYIMQKCGIPIVARSGYEADDIAYTIVKQCYDMYDRIYLYTGDSDWYFMVDEKVSIKPSSSRAKTVTIENFEEVTGYYYNTITFNKICYGDSSDCIPGLDKDVADAITAKLLNSPVRKKLGDQTVITNLFKAMFPQYLYQIDNVYPFILNDIPTTFAKPDKLMIISFGVAIKNKHFIGRKSQAVDITPYISDMCSKGIYLIEEGVED